MKVKDIQCDKLYVAIVDGQELLVCIKKAVRRMGWSSDLTYRILGRKWLVTNYHSGDEMLLRRSQIKSLVEG